MDSAAKMEELQRMTHSDGQEKSGCRGTYQTEQIPADEQQINHGSPELFSKTHMICTFGYQVA